MGNDASNRTNQFSINTEYDPIKLQPASFASAFVYSANKNGIWKKNRVAIVGPANVGKSTLFNQFTQNKVDLAEVGPLPGTTRANHLADAGLFSIIDTPGADAVGEVGENERREALYAAGEADFLIIMFDAIQGIKQTELELYRHLLIIKKTVYHI